jgi:hypothetical protein
VEDITQKEPRAETGNEHDCWKIGLTKFKIEVCTFESNYFSREPDSPPWPTQFWQCEGPGTIREQGPDWKELGMWHQFYYDPGLW